MAYKRKGLKAGFYGGFSYSTLIYQFFYKRLCFLARSYFYITRKIALFSVTAYRVS